MVCSPHLHGHHFGVLQPEVKIFSSLSYYSYMSLPLCYQFAPLSCCIWMSAIVIVASYCHHTVFSHHLHLALYIIGQLRRITQMTPFFFDLLENISYLINSSGDKLHCLLYALSFVVGRETKKKSPCHISWSMHMIMVKDILY